MPSSHARTLFAVTFACMPCTSLLAQAGATVGGIHAGEAFCKTISKQIDLTTAFRKSNPNGLPDHAKRMAYFTDQKALNATLVKTAPTSLSADVVNLIAIANAAYDAQLDGPAVDREAMRAADKRMTPAEHLAASKRVSEYCGINTSVPK